MCQADKQRIEMSLPKILDAKDLIENYYWDLSPLDKNEFLRSILAVVVYYKEKGAEQYDFTLDIMLKL